MDVTIYFEDMMSIIGPVLILCGMLSLTISVIIMLINMMINAFTGKGIKMQWEEFLMFVNLKKIMY